MRLDGLAGSLARSFVADPAFMPQIVATVGLPELVEWLGHVGNMAAYTVLDAAVSPVISPFVDRIENPREKFAWRRRMEGKYMLDSLRIPPTRSVSANPPPRLCVISASWIPLAWKYGSGADYVLPEENEINLNFE